MDKDTKVTQIGLDCHRGFIIAVTQNGGVRLMARRILDGDHRSEQGWVAGRRWHPSDGGR